MPARDLIFTVLGIDKASKTFNDVGDSMDRMAGRATKMVAGIAGASAASSLAVAGAVAGIPLMFAAIGAAALSQNQRVRDSFSSLSETIRTGVIEDAAPMEDSLVGAAQKIGAAYTALRPQMQDAFDGAAPAVSILTDGVIGFATNAMPGLVSAVTASRPVMYGLQGLLESTGRGTSEFFRVISTGAPAAGEGIQHFGTLIENVLPAVGGAVVELTGLWEEHGEQAVRVITDLIGVTEDLGSGALPIVADAMGVALDVLEGALAVIGPLADALGPLIGLWLSLSFALKAISAGNAAITSVTGVIGNFRQGVVDASGPSGVSRLTTAAKGALGIIGGPWGLALATAGIALMIFGQRSQDAAAAQRALAASLKDSAGAFDSNAVATLAGTDRYKDIADNVEKAGLTHRQYIHALAEGGPELDNLKRQLQDTANAGTTSAVAGKGMAVSMTDQAEAARSLLGQTGSLRDIVVAAEEDFRREQNAIAGVAGSMADALPGAESLREAMKTLGSDTADTADKVDALETAWRSLFGIQITLDEAVAGFEASLDELREAITSTKDGVDTLDRSMVNAKGGIDLTTEAGRGLHSSLTEQGAALRELGQTSYDTAIRQKQSQSEATATARAEVTARIGQFRQEMSTLGFTAAQVDVLSRKYLGLPDQIITFIKGDTHAAQQEVDRFIRDNSGKIISVRIQTSGGAAIQPVVPGNPNKPVGLPLRARGGLERAGEWELVGEEGPELRVPAQDGMILPADHTRHILSALINAQRGPVLGSQGSPGGGAGGGFRFEFGEVKDPLVRALVRELRVVVQNTGGGSVQRTLGSG